MPTPVPFVARPASELPNAQLSPAEQWARLQATEVVHQLVREFGATRVAAWVKNAAYLQVEAL
jgi:hypothetical protein